MAEPIPTDDPVVRELLSGPNLARLAYISRSGRPKVVPIWFQYDDGDFVMVTSPRADKTAAIQQNPAVALTIDGARRRIKCCSWTVTRP